MEEIVKSINEAYEAFVTDSNAQIVKGNNAAGVRARKGALTLINLLKEFRKASNEATRVKNEAAKAKKEA